MMCTTCDDKKYIRIRCPYCESSFSRIVDPFIPKDMRCPECGEFGGGGHAYIDCPDCNFDQKSELRVELL